MLNDINFESISDLEKITKIHLLHDISEMAMLSSNTFDDLNRFIVTDIDCTFQFISIHKMISVNVYENKFKSLEVTRN